MVLTLALIAVFAVSLTQEALPGPVSLDGKIIFDAESHNGKLLALGERGRVYVSDKSGKDWSESKLPLEVSLTKIASQDANRLWIVGHDASLFHSTDSGKSWALVRSNPEWEAPYFDIVFLNETLGFVVGAYGSFLETRDGGDSWTKREIDEEGPHFYSIEVLGERELLIAAEFGKILRSDDAGQTWVQETAPYSGSWFGSLRQSDDHEIIFGLRSKVFEKKATSWTELENEGTSSWLTACSRPNGFSVLAGLAGQVLWRDDFNSEWKFFRVPDRPAFSSIVCIEAPHRLLMFGEAGLRVFSVEGEKLLAR